VLRLPPFCSQGGAAKTMPVLPHQILGVPYKKGAGKKPAPN